MGQSANLDLVGYCEHDAEELGDVEDVSLNRQLPMRNLLSELIMLCCVMVIKKSCEIPLRTPRKLSLRYLDGYDENDPLT